MNEAVKPTAEFMRILALPRRAPDGSDLVAPLTELLGLFDQCPGARMPSPDGFCVVCREQRGWMVPLRLRPPQALTLHDLGVYGGAFCALGVGEGKTLITMLAPYVLDARRPILLLPARLIEKTERARKQLALHWRIPTNIRLFSYEMLGRKQAAAELAIYQPDFIMADEVHRLKNRRAAVTRRVRRCVEGHDDAP